MYRYADGRVSPFPPPSGDILGYEEFIAWLESAETYDCLTVTRRSALASYSPVNPAFTGLVLPSSSRK